MDQTVIDDLKQFILATVSQATADHATKQDVAGIKQDVMGIQQDVAGIKQDVIAIKQDVGGLESKMDRRFDDLDLKLSTIADAHAETLEDHEQRLAKMEHRAATT